MRRAPTGARPDPNQKAIVKALEAMGCSVQSLHLAGGGVEGTDHLQAC